MFHIDMQVDIRHAESANRLHFRLHGLAGDSRFREHAHERQ